MSGEFYLPEAIPPDVGLLDFDIGETLAMALAESGDYEQAVRVQRNVIAGAEGKTWSLSTGWSRISTVRTPATVPHAMARERHVVIVIEFEPQFSRLETASSRSPLSQIAVDCSSSRAYTRCILFRRERCSEHEL